MKNDSTVHTSPRNSSFELLRIISMFTLVMYHFIIHGGFSFDPQTLSVPRFYANFIRVIAQPCVDVFILISGYFLINDNRGFFNIKKILAFLGQVLFYSVSIYLIAVVFGIVKLENTASIIKAIIKALFPLTVNSWWFAGTYFVMYLIHPFINIVLRQLDKRTFQKLLIAEFIMWCLIPTFTTSKYQSNDLWWFVTLYSVAAYIRLYGLNPKFTRKHCVIMLLISVFVQYSLCNVLTLLGTKSTLIYNNINYFNNKQCVFTFFNALAMFMFFEKTKINYNKWINIISSASFSVYLIHDNQLIRFFIWPHVFKPFLYQDSIMIIPYSIAVSLLIYIVCTLIDLLRQKIIEKPYMKLVSRISDGLSKLFEKTSNTIMHNFW